MSSEQGNAHAQLAQEGYVDLNGDENVRRLREHQTYRVELFEPRAGQEVRPGFVHYAFMWPDWKPREDELRGMTEIVRTGNLNGNHLAFIATPDGYEAEIVSEPVNFS